MLQDSTAFATEGLRDAAGAMRQAGNGIRKTVGIGVGRIRILAQKRGVRGQDYEGVVILDLREPVAAEKLTLTLHAWRYRLGSGGPMDAEVIVRQSVVLAESQTFESGRYRFSVSVPEAEQPSDEGFGGLAAKAVKVVRKVQALTTNKPEWKLIATLHIPWRRNLSKTVTVDIDEE